MNKWRALGLKLPKVIFLFLLVGLISLNYNKQQQEPAEKEEIPGEVIKEFFPDYTEMVQETKVSYLIKKGEAVMGELIVTAPVAGDLIGFGGTVPLVMAVGTDGKVMGIELLANDESPDFLTQITAAGFFTAWNGLSLQEAAILSVDGVSGASMTTDAVKGSIKKTLAFYLQQETQAKAVDGIALSKNIMGYLILLFALVSMFRGGRLKKYRWVLLSASILILGVWSGYFVSFALLYGWLLNGVPFAGRLFMVVLVALAFLIPLFFGKAFYCSYVCPYGAAQELVGKLRKKKLIPRGGVKRLLKYTRIFYFTVVMVLLLCGLTLDLTMFELFSVFLFTVAGGWAIALGLTFLVLSVFLPRPWCNYFCLTGQLLEFLRRGKVDKTTKRVIKEWIALFVFLIIVLFIVI